MALVLSISTLALTVAPAFAADDVTPPAAVRGMVTSADTSRVKLDWTGNSESDLAGYLVYRATSQDGTYAKLTSTPRTSSDYSDTAAPVGYPTYYKVTAVDRTGNESAPVSVSNTRKDGVKPAAVKSLTGTRSGDAVTLDWADNTEADLAGYLITRATTSGGTYIKLNPTPIKDSTFEDKNAPAGGSYYYKVTAVDFSGYASSTGSVSVLPPDTAAPKPVAPITTTVSTSSIKLDWASNSESDLAGYHVYRANAADGTYTKLTATPRTSSDYTDSTAPVGVASFYRVTAVDKSGNESTPVAASGTRKDGVAPAAVKTLTGNRTADGITLDWADNAEADLAGYVVTRATSSGGTYTRLNATALTASTYVDAGAAAGTAYYYKVTALDASGNSSSASGISVLPPDLTAPVAVRGMVVSADTSRVKLDWTSNTDSDLAGYHVYRSATVDGEYNKLTAAVRTSSDYSDTAAPAGVTSFYRVTAVDKSGNESTPVAASGVRKDGVAPAAVKTLTATAGDDGAVALDWDDSTEADLAGYTVSRATTSGGTYTKLTATPVTTSTYVDTAAPAGAVYYRVSAVDLSGNTSAVANVSFVPADTVAPAVVAGLEATGAAAQIDLTWTAGTDADLAGYYVYRWADGGDAAAAVKLTSAPVTAASYADRAVPTDAGYRYAVTAVDKVGNESARSVDVRAALADTVAPGAPAELTATGSDTDVALDWADNTEADVAGYLVFRSDSATGTFTKLTAAPIEDSAYVDTTAVAGTKAFYRVTAVDRVGNESAAATAEGTRTVAKAPVVGADVTVAKDGSGDFTTVNAALAAAPTNASAPYVIGIKPGTYRELLNVTKPNITFTGATANASDVVITFDNAAGTINPATGAAYGTTGSATVLIRANNVTTKNLTIENSYSETGTGSEQAVALKTVGDKLVFDNVRLLGDQDTLYADSAAAGVLARSYYVNSYVEGDVDFVFGRGTAVFDRSTLHAATRGSSSNNGYVTAASTDKSLTFGYLITDSTITSDAPANSFHLGRPWQPSGDANAVAQVVIRNTELPAAIKTAPWTDMSTTFSWRNARFFEFENTGAGAAVNTDRPQLSTNEAAKFTKFTYLAGADGWNPTGQTPPPPPADTTAPAVPAGLAAEAGDSNVALTWTAGTDADLAGYNLYRSAGTTVALTAANKLNPSALTGTTYTDRTAANGTSYTYAVTAVDKAGNESAAANVTGAPVGVPLPAHDILVAADGTGQHTSVQAALAAAPAGTAAKPTVIAVKPGTYKEMMTVSKSFVTVIGTTGNAKDVVLTYDNAGGTTNPKTGAIYGTGNSQSVLVSGSNVTVKDLTIENSFDEAAVVLAGGEQAVALKTTGDRLRFDNVRLLGNQDTLLVDSPNAFTVARSYFVNSYIEGDVDFIFGRGTAVFQKTTIHALTRGSSSNNGYITAASTSDQNPNGFLIVDSKITSNAPAGTFSLGRPWRGWTDGTQIRDGATYNSRGQVTIANTELPAAIRSTQPWADMSPNLWSDGRFFEYGNTGAGAGVNPNRPQLTDEQAGNATPAKYLAGTDGWNPVS